MLKRTAVLIDAGLLRVKIKQALRAQLRHVGASLHRADGSLKQIHDLTTPQEYAARVVRFAKNCIEPKQEEIYRIFFYDCPPYEAGPSPIKPHPLGAATPIVEPAAITHQKQVMDILRGEEYFAVRTGELSFDGWLPLSDSLNDVITTGRAFTANDFKPLIRQKGIDLKIGVDTTLLAKDRLVERLVLVACDSDLVPAMKLARREGVQIVLVSLGASVKKLLKEHADIYRKPRY